MMVVFDLGFIKLIRNIVYHIIAVVFVVSVIFVIMNAQISTVNENCR